jgi:hypothetical protein
MNWVTNGKCCVMLLCVNFRWLTCYMGSSTSKHTITEDLPPIMNSDTRTTIHAHAPFHRQAMSIRDEETYRKMVDAVFSFPDEQDENVAPNLFEMLSARLQLQINIFMYSGTDYDTQGIIYWLGTMFGRSTEWQNPHNLGVVEARGSSVSNGTIDQLVDRKGRGIRLYTSPRVGEYFLVDFKNIAIKPTHYTLTHMSQDNVPVCWSLHGSSDGEVWTLLRKHDDDQSLVVDQYNQEKSHTWVLDTYGYFSQFKMMMDKPNSSRLEYFIVERFEVYGHVMK